MPTCCKEIEHSSSVFLSQPASLLKIVSDELEKLMWPCFYIFI